MNRAIKLQRKRLRRLERSRWARADSLYGAIKRAGLEVCATEGQRLALEALVWKHESFNLNEILFKAE